MKFLLAIDGSTHSLQAARWALRQAAEGLASEFVLVNVQEPASLYEVVTAHDSAVIEQVRGAAGADLLRDAEALLVAAGIDFESEVAGGVPEHLIVELAENYGCSAIVMGARGWATPTPEGWARWRWRCWPSRRCRSPWCVPTSARSRATTPDARGAGRAASCSGYSCALAFLPTMPSKTQQARPDAAPSARPRSSRSRRPATPEASPAALAEAVPEARPAGSTRKRNRSKPVVESAAVAPVAIVVPVVPVAEAAAPPAGRRRGRGRGRSEDPVDAPPPVSEPVGEPVSLPVPETVAEAPVEAAPPPARSRRGTARARVVEPVVDDVPPAPEPVAVAEPEAERPRKRGTAARRPRPEPPPTVTPQAPPPPPGPQADITPPADGALFGRYAVSVPGEEAAEVTWRSPDAGTALCSCLDFALSEDASCPHVQALQQQLSTRPANTVPGPVGSRIGLQHGACRRLLWLPGSECPPALDARRDSCWAPRRWTTRPCRACCARPARPATTCRSTRPLWSHLAVQRDARWRVHRLQTCCRRARAASC
jgi:nucleotide-binding universal stress UspA family protein